ncbi:hypothetical protein Thi970DRAFT_04839 [Thiorhodovibrio frisius]|uniref:Uncharacterized protein n=2 Tax=Thiorhodovibrio frisius TaxID=631362 RepID=H8Z463_9GAMM|nr:hypothetical protein Thi970DRAFT_04839 [Thiorhodovibrio frisius]WPL22210.1 hypothetical protein Thiofri_02370 [Thiorhodovibrio frisius]
MHNQTPIADIKRLPNLWAVGTQSLALPTYRFYFDGLIAHILVCLPKGHSAAHLGNLIVGGEKSLVLSTVPFDNSWQYMNMRAVIEKHAIVMGG